MLEPTPIPASLPLEPHEGIAAPSRSRTRAKAAHLVTDSLRATIIRVALPAVASSLLMTLFSSVDAFWVGTRIGARGLAAVSTSLFWIWMIISLAEMVERRPHRGGGAPAWRRPRARSRAHWRAIRSFFRIVLGDVVAVAGLPQLDRAVRGDAHAADVTALGARYLSTYLLGAPLIYGFFAIDAAFRASGDTRTPFLLLLSSVAVTLFLDPVLMLGLGPFRRLGIAGAAIATVGTRGAAFLLGYVIVGRRGAAACRAHPDRRRCAPWLASGCRRRLTGVVVHADLRRRSRARRRVSARRRSRRSASATAWRAGCT